MWSLLFAASHLVSLDGFCQVTGREVAEWRNLPLYYLNILLDLFLQLSDE